MMWFFPRRLSLMVAVAAAGACNEPGPAYPFSCGELDMYHAHVLVGQNGLFEEACGRPGPDSGWADADAWDGPTSWKERAAELRMQGTAGPCAAPQTDLTWSFLRRGCRLETHINLAIAGHRAAACAEPPYDYGFAHWRVSPALGNSVAAFVELCYVQESY